MKIIKDVVFIKSLEEYVKFIAKDSPQRAKKFAKDVNKKIRDLKDFPYKFRKSYFHDREDVRDLIFKGYVIPYLIDEKNQVIVILDIFKWQNR